MTYRVRAIYNVIKRHKPRKYYFWSCEKLKSIKQNNAPLFFIQICIFYRTNVKSYDLMDFRADVMGKFFQSNRVGNLIAPKTC